DLLDFPGLAVHTCRPGLGLVQSIDHLLTTPKQRTRWSALQWYRVEIARRDSETQTRPIVLLTAVITVLTLANVVAAIGVWVSTKPKVRGPVSEGGVVSGGLLTPRPQAATAKRRRRFGGPAGNSRTRILSRQSSSSSSSGWRRLAPPTGGVQGYRGTGCAECPNPVRISHRAV